MGRWMTAACLALVLAAEGPPARGQESAPPTGTDAVESDPPSPDLLEKIAAVTSDPELKAALGEIVAAWKEGRWGEVLEKASAQFEIRKSPRDRVLFSMAGLVAGSGRRDHEAALLWAERGAAALSALPRDEFRQVATCVLESLRFEEYLRLGRKEDAKAALQSLLEASPESWRDEGIRRRLVWVTAGIPPVVVGTCWGPFRNDVRLPEALKALLADLPLAMERLRTRLGLEALVLPPMTVLLVEGKHGGEPGGGKWLMQAYRETHAGRVMGCIEVRIEPLLSDMMDRQTALTHELTHILEITMGDDPENMPDWLREGIAHWSSWQGDGELQVMVLGVSVRPASAAPVVSVSRTLQSEEALTSSESMQGRIAGTLILRRLEEVKGLATARRAVLRWMKGEDWRKVLEEESGKPFPDYLGDVRAMYLDWVERVFPGARALSKATGIAEHEDADRGLALIDEVLGTMDDGPLRGYGEHARARCLEKLGRMEEARVSLGQFRRKYPRHALLPKALADEVDLLRKSAAPDAAAILARQFLRDHGWEDVEWAKHMREFLEEREDGKRGE